MNVLLIEDNPTDAMIVAALLRARRLTVSTVSSLQQALESLSGGLPDVVLSDLRLPDAAGAEIILALRARLPRTGLVAYSGSDPWEPLPEVDAFLPKDGLRGPTLEWILRHAAARRTAWFELSTRDSEPI